MTTLRDLGLPARVTGYLMCTDNMPSGTAHATRRRARPIHGGKTVEVVNADAEGRLVMADGLVMAVEDRADAIVTIATLTGAAMRTFGTGPGPGAREPARPRRPARAGGRRRGRAALGAALVQQYRRQIDSKIADIKNMGGENAGTITAGLFLEDFVAGTPFGHLDICGPMVTDTDDGWRPTGATAFGTRLLSDLAIEFRKPTH